MKLKSLILIGICILAYFANIVVSKSTSLQQLPETLPTNEEQKQQQISHEIKKLFQEGKLSESGSTVPVAIPTVTVEVRELAFNYYGAYFNL